MYTRRDGFERRKSEEKRGDGPKSEMELSSAIKAIKSSTEQFFQAASYNARRFWITSSSA